MSKLYKTTNETYLGGRHNLYLRKMSKKQRKSIFHHQDATSSTPQLKSRSLPRHTQCSRIITRILEIIWGRPSTSQTFPRWRLTCREWWAVLMWWKASSSIWTRLGSSRLMGPRWCRRLLKTRQVGRRGISGEGSRLLAVCCTTRLIKLRVGEVSMKLRRGAWHSSGRKRRLGVMMRLWLGKVITCRGRGASIHKRHMKRRCRRGWRCMRDAILTRKDDRTPIWTKNTRKITRGKRSGLTLLCRWQSTLRWKTWSRRRSQNNYHQ